MKPILKFVTLLTLSFVLFNVSYLTAQHVHFDEPYLEIGKLTDGDQVEKAEKAINSKIQADSKDEKAYYQKGYLKYSLEDYDGAIEAFKAGIKASSKYPYNHVGLGKVYGKKGMKEEAQGAFDQVIKVNKKGDHNVMLLMADAYIAADLKKEAEITLYKVREENPEDARAYYYLAQYNLARGVDELAKTYLIQAVEKDPSYVSAYFPLGQITVREAEAVKIKDDDADDKKQEKRDKRKALFNEGLQYLNKAVEVDPSFASSYKVRGELYLKAKMYDEARDDYKKYIELLPNDERAKYRYAQFLYLSENYQESIDMLKSLTGMNSLVKTRLMAYSYTEMGNFEEAQKYIDEYFETAKEDEVIPEDYENLAKLEMKRENTEKAMAHYVTMLEMQGDNDPCEYFNEQAKAFKRKKDYPMQAKFLQGVITCKGEDAGLKDYYNLGYSYYRVKNYEQSIPAFTKCTEIKEDWEAGWYFKGSSLHNTDPEGAYIAREDFQKVYDILSATPAADLSKSETSHLKTATTYLAFYYFYPEKKDAPTADDYHCEAAQPYVNKVLELDADDKVVTQITGYCDELRAAGGK